MAKRQKTVFNRDMVAHVWAQQSQHEGRTSSGNFYFRGQFLYSCRDSYPVGRIMGEIALIWNGRYSVTTSRHTSIAAHAVRGKYTVLTVPHLGSRYDGEHNAEQMHRDNVAELTTALGEATDKALKRSHQPACGSLRYQFETYLPREADEIRSYCASFPVELPDYVRDWDREALLAQYDANHAAAVARAEQAGAKLLARFGSQEAVDAYHERKRLLSRAGAAAKVAAKVVANSYVGLWDVNSLSDVGADLRAHLDANPNDTTVAARLATLQGALDHIAAAQQAETDRLARWRAWRDQLAGLPDHERDAAATDDEARGELRALHNQEGYERAEARKRALRAEFDSCTSEEQIKGVTEGRYERSWLSQAQEIAAWRLGLQHRHYHGSGAPCALRLHPSDPDTVQTSWGASFPADHARRIWPLLCRIRATGRAWHRPDNHQTVVGHFTVDGMAADGTIKAGCHVIAWSEIEHLAALLDLRPMSDIVQVASDTVAA